MSILTLLAALLPSATLLMSNPSTDSPDYTTVPPDPYEVEQRLSAAPINAQEAVKQAEEKSGGTVTSLATRFNGENVEYELVVVLNGVSRKVIVDGATGAVTAPMVVDSQRDPNRDRIHRRTGQGGLREHRCRPADDHRGHLQRRQAP